MPQSSDELRSIIHGYFGGGPVTDIGPPLEFLKSQGWTETKGYLTRPFGELTQKEWDCLDYLIEEWDFDITAGVVVT